jgi:hypothetical protein
VRRPVRWGAVNTVFPGRVVANAWAGQDAGRPRACWEVGRDYRSVEGRDCQLAVADAQRRQGERQVHLDAPMNPALRQQAAHSKAGDVDQAAREQEDALQALWDAMAARNFLVDPRGQRDESE